MRVRLGSHVFTSDETHTLAEEYCTSVAPYGGRPECNRHDRERWLRQFRDVARVAHDALLAGERGRAMGVLIEMLDLDNVLSLLRPPRSMSECLDEMRRKLAASTQIPTVFLFGEQLNNKHAAELAEYPEGTYEDRTDAMSRARLQIANADAVYLVAGILTTEDVRTSRKRQLEDHESVV